MKVFKQKSDQQKIKLPALRITTDELIALLGGSNAEKAEIEFQIGESFGDHVILESLMEIKEHAAQIEIPCLIKLDGLEIEFSKYDCSIVFAESQRPLAKSIEKRLTAYRAWYSIFFEHPTATAIPLAILIAFSYEYFGSSLSVAEIFGLLVGAFLVLAYVFINLLLWLNRPHIIHVERDSFWRRNSDKFALGIIMLIAGLLLRELFEFLTS